ncbi:programmed cell death protein 2 [Chytridium lagenaria]|nr:programmed cell death protein 2 [Chytridium lagenaria]
MVKSRILPRVLLEFAYEEDSPDASEQYKYENKLYEQYRKSGGIPIDTDALDDGDDGSGMSWAGEGYEKVRPKGYDKLFKRFYKTVEKEPEQCLRYAFNGQPLFYASDAVFQSLTTVGPPPCPQCQSPRVFEMQLMPAVLSLLPTEQLAARTRKEEAKAEVKLPSKEQCLLRKISQ